MWQRSSLSLLGATRREGDNDNPFKYFKYYDGDNDIPVNILASTNSITYLELQCALQVQRYALYL